MGRVGGGSHVENSFATGNVSCEHINTRCGPVFGDINAGGTETNNYFDVNATIINSGTGGTNTFGNAVDLIGAPDYFIFGYIDRAIIKSIGLENVAISALHEVGALAGQVAAAVVMNAYASGSVEGVNNVGGLVGHLEGPSSSTGWIFESYATPVVRGGSAVGGLVGLSTSDLEHCFSTADVRTGAGGIGGPIVGTIGGTVTNSYFLATAPCTNCDNTVGTSTATLSYFYDPGNEPYLGSWDFTNTWTEDPTLTDFPTHR